MSFGAINFLTGLEIELGVAQMLVLWTGCNQIGKNLGQILTGFSNFFESF